MARRVFFSFYYKEDYWRTSQVRNIGAIDSNKPVSDNDWEVVKKNGDDAIKKWIDKQLEGRSCLIVLVGKNTSKRRWVRYEIKKAWQLNKGIVGICIHNLKDQNGDKSEKGGNPFSTFKLGDKKLSNVVKLYDPPFKKSTNVYEFISDNLDFWVEEAIDIRKRYSQKN